MTFDQTEYEYEDFSECRPEEGKISRIKFRHCDFRAADFTDFATESCVFQECNFTAARLGASVHQGSAFLNCRFSLARLFSAEFHHCKMTGSDFGGADCLGLLIDGGDWSLTSLQEIDFGRMSLTDVNFRGSDLQNAVFEKARLSGCSFEGANLSGATFKNADMRTCNIQGLDPFSVTLTGAKIDMEQAVYIAFCHGAKYTP